MSRNKKIQTDPLRVGGEVRQETVWRASLLVAGACTTKLGVYHFFLPSVFRWNEYVHGEPEPIWAIFAMNAFLSFLLCGGGACDYFYCSEARPVWGDGSLRHGGNGPFLDLQWRISGAPAATLSCAAANWI